MSEHKYYLVRVALDYVAHSDDSRYLVFYSGVVVGEVSLFWTGTHHKTEFSPIGERFSHLKSGAIPREIYSSYILVKPSNPITHIPFTKRTLH